MAILDYQTDGKTALITMTNGANQQNLDFANTMLAALERAEADKAVRAVVITSNDEKNWSQGVDLNWLMGAQQAGDEASIRAFMLGMNKVFAKLLTLHVPTIAAITGHAFGNGAMMACACDFRFMRADRGYFCFPEIDISIPFLPSMIAYIRKAIPEHRFNEMALSGRRVTAEELAREHIISAALPDADATLKAAMEYAASFNKSPAIYGEQKRRMHKAIVDKMAQEDQPLIDALKLTV